MSDKHGSDAGAERTAVSGSGPTGAMPAGKITQEEFVRTCYAEEMSRKQRRYVEKRLGKPGVGKLPKTKKPF